MALNAFCDKTLHIYSGLKTHLDTYTINAVLFISCGMAL